MITTPQATPTMNALPYTPYAELSTTQLLDRYQQILMKAPALITILSGSDLVFELVNDSYQQLFSGRVLLGKPLLEAVPEIKGQPIEAILNNVLDTGKTYLGAEVLITLIREKKTLEDAYFNFIYQARLNTEGRVDGILVFAFEVTEIVKTKKLAEENESYLRSLVLNAHYSLMILRGKDLIVETVNQEMTRILNKPIEEVIGKPLSEILSPDDNSELQELLKKVYQTGKAYTSEEKVFYFDSPEGRITKYVSFFTDPIFNAAGQVSGVISSGVDITEKVQTRKLLEKSLNTQQLLINELSRSNRKLEEANANLRALNLHLNTSRQELQQSKGMLQFSIEAAKIGTWSLDLNTMVPAFSARQKELYGFHPTEEVGVNELVNQVVAEYRDKSAELMQQVIVRGGLYDLNFPVLGFHDQKLRWLRVLGSLKTDASGGKSYFSGVSIEITEQVEVELRKDHFINIVSHELKTPLTSAKVYVQILQQKADEQGYKYFSDTLKKADLKLDKMTGLINNFLNVSQLESGKIKLEFSSFELNSLITELLNEPDYQSYATNIKFTPSDNIILRADRDKIGQVITNLLGNAIKYATLNKTIKICCEAEAGQATVSVQDFGIGISDDEQQQIFRRYYRVEGIENAFISGFGIGLYLCTEILDQHNGRLSVESKQGRGSTFSFSLPLNNPN